MGSGNGSAQISSWMRLSSARPGVTNATKTKSAAASHLKVEPCRRIVTSSACERARHYDRAEHRQDDIADCIGHRDAEVVEIDGVDGVACPAARMPRDLIAPIRGLLDPDQRSDGVSR